MPIIDGIDLDLLLEDNARLTKRVAELEDNQEKLIKFMAARFPKHGNQLKKLLSDQEEQKRKSKPKNTYSSFGQEDDGISTEDAIKMCFSAKPISVDPVLQKVGIVSKTETAIPASLRG